MMAYSLMSHCCSPVRKVALACILSLILLTYGVNALIAAEATDQSLGAARYRIPSWAATLGNSKELSPDDSFTVNVKTIVTVVLTCFCALLANAAGIGGGPIYLPLLMIVLGFGLTPATALSHTVVACSAIASSIYGLIATSPNDPKRTLIDWDLTIFIPALLVGVSIGVLFNVLFPSWLQTILLTILLLVVIVKTLSKGIRMWQSERKDASLKQRLLEDQDYQDSDSGSETEGVLHEEAYHIKPHRLTRQLSGQGMTQDSLRLEAQPPHASRSQTIDEYSKADKAKASIRGCFGRQPYFKIVSIVVLWIVFLTFQQSKTRYGNCSWPYFGLFVSEVILFSAATVAGIFYLSRQAKQRPNSVDPELRGLLLPDGGDTPSQSNRSSMKRLSFVAGVMVFAARALIFNPFLLALGVNPQVTASTSVLMILFSSSAIAISLGFQGYLNASYAAVLAPVAFVSSIIGVTLVGRLIKKTGHTSIIVFILTFLISIGTVLTAVFGGIKAADDFRQGNIGFKDFCHGDGQQPKSKNF